ncbi:MAG: alkaline phosphatase D family protein, partial [Lentisphaeraceae bacterium]|nr:alkaline phosphatase D family protein [Lentisphaeraceae bacterium]
MLKKTLAACMLFTAAANADTFTSQWSNEPNRTWAGKDYWANRLQDWKIENGSLHCIAAGRSMAYRTVHLVPYRLNNKQADLKASVEISLLTADKKKGHGGFILGVGPQIEHLKATLVFGGYGKNNGTFAGWRSDGKLVIIDMENGKVLAKSSKSVKTKSAKLELSVKGKILTLTSAGSQVSVELPWNKIAGNLALTSHAPRGSKSRFAFKNWNVDSDSLVKTKTKTIGPIISAQHTLSRRVMKMTVQLAPVYTSQFLTKEQIPQKVHLQLKQNGTWQTVDQAIIVVPGFTAHFRQMDWNDSEDTAYRLVFKDLKKNGSLEECLYEGTIKANPVDSQNIKVAAFTGNHNLTSWGSSVYASNDRITYPHTDLYSKVMKHQPDLFFWSGDQVYEGGSPSGPDKSGNESSYYDYLYKWYLWCLSARDITKDYPSVILPDDHDVFQGNIWGAGGKPGRTQDDGGYQMPSQWVRMVDRTQSSHHPDPFDSRPIGYDLQSYFTHMVYGRISFAILEDRKFKKGPRGTVFPANKRGRADHVTDPNQDTRKLDQPGLTLLGDRQLKFLNFWSKDWKDADMKCVLTQSVFANVATHHGPGAMHGKGFLVADLDSNGWPQAGRNRALREIRRGFAFTIGGDQHLGSIVQHGIDDWSDAGYAFTVPSIANFYPRAWLPKAQGKNHIAGMPSYTGEFHDSFKNKMTVWAVNNPGAKTGQKPASVHDKMPGYGIIYFDKKSRDITMECWPRFADPSDRSLIYNGWPKTVNAQQNYGRKATAHLPLLKISGISNPVVQVINEGSSEVIYTLRIKGLSFRPKVFSNGKYTIRVGKPDNN